MTEFVPQNDVAAEPVPVDLVLEPALQRNRLTTFFRLLLVIPHLIVAALAGILLYIVVPLA